MDFNKHFEKVLENKIEQNNTKIKALSIQIENINREMDSFFKELQINFDNLSEFMSKKDNFTEENWEELSKQKKMIEERLQRELDNIRNPLKAKHAQSSQQHVQRHWLFVK